VTPAGTLAASILSFHIELLKTSTKFKQRGAYYLSGPVS
jgi:hypothetical protein